MSPLAIIGGTGLARITGLTIERNERITTPYGSPSADYVVGAIQGKPVVFLARHGNPHLLAPHRINYRANLFGLKHLGVKTVIAVAAVGGITEAMAPAHIAIPDQIIDYSYGRKHTFFEDDDQPAGYIDFSYPYSQTLRARLITAAAAARIPVTPVATYGCTQGPRLETAAEILRMERDGCDVVGMTGMPEAALARELGMEYAAMAVIANKAAGKSGEEITMAEIEHNLHKGMANAIEIINAFIAQS
ncbi:S-methyl-5'-thioinosine phosphorylase [Methylosarcina fibrata]|uniref:S-methyl-5'-thioinosine phosphorylase n=1 Tax=Methylosarcina fibrata TaxID=105972 RepID=UPI000369D524|nr:S-methyl-5'-thioinosine phosphorylase [Methylosarcina fibrata]